MSSPWDNQAKLNSLNIDNGNIGIGTDTPNATLDIDGDVLIGTTLNVGNGSSSEVSYGFLGDVNTGIYNPNANVIGFSNAGSESMRINSSGNIGIGTDNPVADLHIHTDGNTKIQLTNSDTGPTDMDGSFIGLSGNEDFDIWNREASSVRIATNGTQRLDITSTGDILCTSTEGAFRVPRLTTTQRNALTATNGMLVYNTTDNKFQGYENGSWTNLI